MHPHDGACQFMIMLEIACTLKKHKPSDCSATEQFWMQMFRVQWPLWALRKSAACRYKTTSLVALRARPPCIKRLHSTEWTPKAICVYGSTNDLRWRTTIRSHPSHEKYQKCRRPSPAWTPPCKWIGKASRTIEKVLISIAQGFYFCEKCRYSASCLTHFLQQQTASSRQLPKSSSIVFEIQKRAADWFRPWAMSMAWTQPWFCMHYTASLSRQPLT